MFSSIVTAEKASQRVGGEAIELKPGWWFRVILIEALLGIKWPV